MSALPEFSMKEMIECGVHFGHKTKRWNPKMAPFLYGIRNDVHIIDLQQTAPLMRRTLTAVKEIVARNGRVLFVSTKPQASEVVAEYAKRCGQYYVNHRWLGGMLTNWNTVSQSIKKLKKMEEVLSQEKIPLTKQEILKMTRERDKMDKAFGGIKDMGGLPDIIFVIDTNREEIAVKEANRLGIPIAAVLDSNCDPEGITYAIPGNDDSTRSISFYCRLISDAVLSGIQDSLSKSGIDFQDKDGSGKMQPLKNRHNKGKPSGAGSAAVAAESSPEVAPAVEATGAAAVESAAQSAADAPAASSGPKDDDIQAA
jgi:small subunit ribosomal protein S2